MTQLLVIDTVKNEIKAFDGKVLVDKFKVPEDMELTREEQLENLDFVRRTSTIQRKEARRQMELMAQQENDAKRWAPKYVIPVVLKSKTPVS